MKVYVASSWRNLLQPGLVAALRAAGLEVYDFKHPAAGNDGFHWSEIDGGWKNWTPQDYVRHLDHPIACKGFASDFDAMKWADCCVLVLPCGRSAHLEAGWFAGAGKPVYILMLEAQESELMYKMCARVCVSMDDLFDALNIPN